MISYQTTRGVPLMSQTTPLRKWTDKHVISHVAFLPSIYISFSRESPIFELPLLVICLVILSTAYHRQREPSGTLLSNTESFFAYTLYFYGCAQIVYAPSVVLQYIYVCLSIFTSTTYLTGLMKGESYWDKTHYVGMHIVPGIWCSLVAYYNNPIFD